MKYIGATARLLRCRQLYWVFLAYFAVANERKKMRFRLPADSGELGEKKKNTKKKWHRTEALLQLALD